MLNTTSAFDVQRKIFLHHTFSINLPLYENVSKPLNFKAKPAREAKAGGALRWVPYITLALF